MQRYENILDFIINLGEKMFNVEAFRNANLKTREKSVRVDLLPDAFFADGAKKEFKLRMLSGNELAQCNEAVKLASQTKEVIEKMLSGHDKDRVKAFCDASGFSDAVKPDTVRKMNILKYAIVEPELTFEDIVRMQQFFPVVFNSLAIEAVELTGLGAELGE